MSRFSKPGGPLQIEIKRPDIKQCQAFVLWCPVAESNHGHEDFQSSALPTELTGHIAIFEQLLPEREKTRIKAFVNKLVKPIIKNLPDIRHLAEQIPLA